MAGARLPVSMIFTRMTFQRLVLFSVTRLSIYLFKLFEDTSAVKDYKTSHDYYFMIISAACLITPPLFYSIFLMGQNLTKDDTLDKNELGTKAVNGLLLIPWQIKRHLDVLHFAAQRVCTWRPPNKQEDEEMVNIKRNAEVLEFFEDIYAGFLQILLQLYLLFGAYNISTTHNIHDKQIISELVASSMCVVSMLIAVRRRDDGPLTATCSFLGWTSLIFSRVLVMSFVATYIHGWLFALCFIHVLAVSYWVYQIAIESHRAAPDSPVARETDDWAQTRKRTSLAVLVVLFFGIPSLLIWPIMFQLKEKRRPFTYFMIIIAENALLLLIWFIFHLSSSTTGLNTYSIYLMIIITVCTLSGVFFLLVYTFCKPKLTDQIILHEIREARAEEPSKLGGLSLQRALNATQYGIYYEFCDIVFRLPSTAKMQERLDEVRRLTEPQNSSTTTVKTVESPGVTPVPPPFPLGPPPPSNPEA